MASSKEATNTDDSSCKEHTGLLDYINESSTSSSSSSDELKSRKSRKFRRNKSFPPRHTSDWNEDDLAKIGISYAPEPLDLPDIVSELKELTAIKSELVNLEIPQLCKKLLEITKSVWTFSASSALLTQVDEDFGEPENQESKERRKPQISESSAKRTSLLIDQQLEAVEDAKDCFEAMYGDIKTQISEDLKKGPAAEYYFSMWRVSLMEFWDYYSGLILRIDKKPMQLEGRYTQLFMQFSRIFFLQPEIGKTYKEQINVKSTWVRGVPDVRFLSKAQRDKKAQKVLIVTEVKRPEGLRKWDQESFTHKRISPEVLGQHGIQLLMEIQDSFFKPAIVGILCIGTQLVFTYLSVDIHHLHKIQTTGEVSGHQSHIFYTKPYNFMVEADRREIFEHMFWFGFLQNGSKMDSLV